MANEKKVEKPVATTDENVNVKKERFKKVAGNRVSKILDTLDNLENCASPNYEYSQAQITQIETAITTKFQSVLKSFKEKKVKEKAGFVLGE